MKKHLFILLLTFILYSSCQSQITKFEGVWFNSKDLDNSIEIIKNTDSYTLVIFKREKEQDRLEFKGKINNNTLELYRDQDKNNLLRITIDNKGRLLFKDGKETFVSREEYIEIEKKQLAKKIKEAKEVEKIVKSRFLNVINSYQNRNKNVSYFIEKIKIRNEISQLDYDKFQDVLQLPTTFDITKKSIKDYIDSQKSIAVLIQNTLSTYNKNTSISKSQDDLIKIEKHQSYTNVCKVSVARYNESFSNYSKYIDLPKIRL